VFAIANRRTCVAIATSGGISETVEEAGGKESVIVPRFDCTISVYVRSISVILPASQRYTHTADCKRHKCEKGQEIWILYEVCEGYFIGFLNGDRVDSLIAFPRAGQEAGGLIDGHFGFLVRPLQHRMATRNGEHECTKQVCSASDEGEEGEVLREVEARLRIGEDDGGEKGEEQGRQPVHDHGCTGCDADKVREVFCGGK